MRRLATIMVVVLVPALRGADAPLPSWNDGKNRTAILDFVARVTRPDGPDFVRPEERIAVFDNDGTLWVEKPMYTEIVFAMSRVQALAARHPEWKEMQPFKAALDNDVEGVIAAGPKGLAQLILATHSGMTVADFEKIASDWLAAARHPRFKRPYTELTYLPMVELMAYLREQGFKTYIVSGGGTSFMRVYTQKAYGVPPEQVIGTTYRKKFELRGGKAELLLLREFDLVDDGPGKAMGISQYIGRRPVFAAGNSDHDIEMLQWTTLERRPALAFFVHHDDAEREYSYDRKSFVGRLDRGLEVAPKAGWLIISMKNDWKKIFAWEK